MSAKLRGLFKPKPWWSNYLTKTGYEVFRAELLSGSEGTIDADGCDAAGQLQYGEARINVANLVQICATLPEGKWEEEIHRWIKAFTAGDTKGLPKYPRDVRRLKLQLYPADYFGGAAEAQKMLAREDLPGVLTTVVIDRPDALVAATRDGLADWARHQDRTYELLLKQLKKEPRHHTEFVRLDEQHDDLVAVLLSDEITAANHVLALDSLYPQFVGEYGALVAVPHRQMVLVKRLDTEPDKHLLAGFGKIVKFMTANQPGFISDKVYWFRDGTYRLVTP